MSEAQPASTSTGFMLLLAVVAYLAGGGLVSLWVTLQYGIMVQTALWSVHGLLVALTVVLAVRWFGPA